MITLGITTLGGILPIYSIKHGFWRTYPWGFNDCLSRFAFGQPCLMASRLQFHCRHSIQNSVSFGVGNFRCHVVMIRVGLVIRVVVFLVLVLWWLVHIGMNIFLVHYINNIYIYDTMYIPFVIQREERYLVHISYHATSILYTIYKHNSYGFKEFCTSFISPPKSPCSIQWFHATTAGTMKALVTIAAIHELQGKIHFFQDFWLVDFWT